MKRFLSGILMLAISVAFFGGVPGCGDDVKKEYQHEQTQESEPEMESPGEMVVE